MPDFEIKIKTPTELAGALAAAEALEKDIGKAKALGQEFGDMQKKLDAVKESIANADPAALEDVGKKLHEGGEQAKMFGEHAHEAHSAIHALGEIIPGVGGLARQMFSPATAGIAIFGMGLGYLIRQLEETEAAQAKFATEVAKGIGAKLAEQGTAAQTAASEHQAFADALNHAATGESSFFAAMSNRQKAFKDYIDGLEAVAKKEDEIEERRIQRQMQSGDISKEEGQSRLESIRAGAGARSQSDQDRIAVQKLQDAQVALHNAQQEKDRLAGEAQAAADKARELDEKHKAAATRAGTGEGSEATQLAQSQAKLDEAIKKRDEEMRRLSGAPGGEGPMGAAGTSLMDTLRGMFAIFGTAPSQAKVDKASQAVEEAAQERDRHVTAQKQAQGEATRLAAEAQAAKDAAADAKKRLDDNSKTIAEYGGPQGKVAQDSAQIDRDRARNAAVASVDAAAAAKDKAELALAATAGDTPRTAQAKEDARMLLGLVKTLTAALEAEQAARVEDHQGLAHEIWELQRRANQLTMRADTNRGY